MLRCWGCVWKTHPQQAKNDCIVSLDVDKVGAIYSEVNTSTTGHNMLS